MRFQRLVAASMSVGLLFVASAADAALNAYLTLKGTKQGQIKGESTAAGRIAVVDVTGFLTTDYESPRDAASGLPSGKRQHKPIVVTKVLGAADPQLQQAFKTGEAFDDWTLVVADEKGGTTTIKLANARAIRVAEVPPGTKATWVQGGKTYEQLWFTFDKITVTHTGGGVAPTSETHTWVE
jgi:type VI secretion system secreted protein Hcp